MHITGTHVSYLHLCHRKLWLFANGINMEQNSALVAEGKFIDVTSYSQRAARRQALETRASNRCGEARGQAQIPARGSGGRPVHFRQRRRQQRAVQLPVSYPYFNRTRVELKRDFL